MIRMALVPRAFTLIELLVVVVVVCVLLALVATSMQRAKRAAKLASQRAQAVQRLNDAISRGAIKDYKEYQFWLDAIDRQMKTGWDMKQLEIP